MLILFGSLVIGLIYIVFEFAKYVTLLHKEIKDRDEDLKRLCDAIRTREDNIIENTALIEILQNRLQDLCDRHNMNYFFEIYK